MVRRGGALLTMLALVCFAGLGLLPGPSPREAASTESMSIEVTYALAWDQAGVTALPDGGWQTVTDTGYQVQLDRGALVSYSLQLLKSEEPAADALLSQARAGHSGPLDPLAIEAVCVESLRQPAGQELGTRVGPVGRYERLHYLVARGNETALAADGTSFNGTSLMLEGRYRLGSDGAWQTFAVHTSMANGVQTSTPDALDLQAGQRVRVTVSRALGTLFDGVSFDRDDQRAIGWKVLKNLIEGCRVEVVFDA